MSLYEGVAYKGTFRGYQQRVLHQAEPFLAKGKLNMVAAPGSGKTILGLELIRSLGEACLIISPTEATIAHWEKQLRENFLADNGLIGEVFSTDLEKPKVINAITYKELAESMETYASDGEKKSVKLRRMIRVRKINTICLEEPHHLKDEYISALRQLRELLEKDEKFIYLTSTPPCEYEEAEYMHFNKMCGGTDCRILESELVEEQVLYPHQDYVYLNYPSEEEAARLMEYMDRVQAALDEIGKLSCVQDFIKTANLWKSVWAYQYIQLHDKIKRRAPEAYIPILQLLQYFGLRINSYRAKRLTGKKKLPPIQLKDMQVALQFLLEQYDTLGEHRKPIMQILRKYGLYEKKSVRLVPKELLYEVFTASVGKLYSIRDIVDKEHQICGKDLRLLIFSEGMCQNAGNIARIGTTEEFRTVDAISIFETLRQLNKDIRIAVLTKDLVILPVLDKLEGTMMRTEPLGDTGYVKVEFFDGMTEALDLVKELFVEGTLQVMITDRTLQNEEWLQNPVNSLILPGFVRDFSLSHMLRGIVLQRSAGNPEKYVHIWHPVTVTAAERIEAESPRKIHTEYLGDCDLEMVRARFQLFTRYDNENNELEHTIKNIVLSRTSFENWEIQRINRKMLEYSADRESIRKA